VQKPRAVESTVRVRYAETDAEGVVYYANHFIYMEVGRVNYFRAMGIEPAELDRSGWGIVISEATCHYHAPARFDDRLIIRTWVENVRRSSFAFVYEIVRAADRRVIAAGRTVQVIVDLDTMRPIRLPPEMREILSAAPAPSNCEPSSQDTLC
jgi:acyl-CoA thioester hydrolase